MNDNYVIDDYFFFIRFNDTIITTHKNIAAAPSLCMNNDCYNRCSDNKLCEICLPCLDNRMKYHMKEAYRENISKGNFKRIFPSKNFKNDTGVLNSLTHYNLVMMKFYEEKCLEDERWC